MNCLEKNMNIYTFKRVDYRETWRKVIKKCKDLKLFKIPSCWKNASSPSALLRLLLLHVHMLFRFLGFFLFLIS